MPRADSLIPTPKRNVTHIVIPIGIWEDDSLMFTEKILLSEIVSLQDPEKGCFASNAYLAKFLQVTPMRVSQLISKLKKKKFIEEVESNGPHRVLRVYPRIYAGYILGYTIYNTSKEVLKDYKKNSDAERIASSENPSPTISRTGNAAKQRASTHKKTPDPTIQQVVDYFKTSVKTELKFDPVIEPRDYKTVKDRLKQFKQEDIKAIVEWCLKSDKTQWQREHATLSSWLSANTINQYKASKSGNGSSRFTQGGGIKAEAGKYAHLGKEV